MEKQQKRQKRKQQYQYKQQQQCISGNSNAKIQLFVITFQY